MRLKGESRNQSLLVFLMPQSNVQVASNILHLEILIENSQRFYNTIVKDSLGI